MTLLQDPERCGFYRVFAAGSSHKPVMGDE